MTKIKTDLNSIIQALFDSDNSDAELNEDGEPIAVGETLDGKKHGIWYYFNDDSDTCELYTYINGSINGEYKYFISNGLICKGFKLNSIYNKEGLFFYYNYDNDEIRETGNYKNDKRDGEWLQFRNGIKYLIIYENNKPWRGVNIADEYYSDSKGNRYYAATNYKNGLKDGEEKIFFSSGELHSIAYFKNDKREGEEKSYYRDGSLLLKCYFNNGNRDGELIAYYPNGQIMRKRYWKSGNSCGVWLEYDEHGAIKSQVNNPN